MLSVRKQPRRFLHLLNSIPRSLFFWATLAASFGSVTLAADTPGDLLKRQFEAAKAALAANDLVQAENHYRQAIAVGLRQLANLAISEERFEQATTLLEDAVKLAPGDANLRIDAGIAWFRRGDTKKATELIEDVLRVQPDNAHAHNLLGRIDLFKGDTEGAIQELKRPAALQDDFETSYFLGVALLKAKKVSEASALFSQLQSAMGNTAALHVLFGRAYTITHFPEPAIAEFRAAIKLDPKYPRAHGLLGYSMLEFRGEEAYPEARKEFEKELQLEPDQYYFLSLLGIATVALRDYPAAEATLLHAIRLNSTEPGPYLYLGETYSETGRTKQAVDALQKYISFVRNPEEMVRDVSRAYYLLGQNLRRLGRLEEAQKALANSQRYREAKFRYDAKHTFDEPGNPSDGDSHTSDRIEGLIESAAPDDRKATEAMVQEGVPEKSAAQQPAESKDAKQYRSFVAEILASSYNDLGVMRAKAANFTEAAEYFKQAAAWNPALPGLDRNWGLASYRAELYKEAIPPLQRQLAAAPNDAFVRQLLGLSFFLSDNFEKTVEALRPLLNDPPDDPGLLLAWGTALVRTRQSETARLIFERLLKQNANNPAVHLLLGQAYAQQQDYTSALTELKTALQLNSRLPEAHFYTGLIYLRQSDFTSAASEFRAELAMRPGDTAARYHLGYALFQQGDLEHATPILREVAAAKPDYELARFELGRALLQQGDAVGAVENFEAAKKLFPGREATYFQLSQAYRRAGRLPEAEQALATYQKMIEANRQKKRQELEIEQP
jgi:tetratricopeptide (TPR) repeat protein